MVSDVILLRYDMDASETINDQLELRQLCVNIVVQELRGMQSSVQEIKDKVSAADEENSLAREPWSESQFVEWFVSTFELSNQVQGEASGDTSNTSEPDSSATSRESSSRESDPTPPNKTQTTPESPLASPPSSPKSPSHRGQFQSHTRFRGRERATSSPVFGQAPINTVPGMGNTTCILVELQNIIDVIEEEPTGTEATEPISELVLDEVDASALEVNLSRRSFGRVCRMRA